MRVLDVVVACVTPVRLSVLTGKLRSFQTRELEKRFHEKPSQVRDRFFDTPRVSSLSPGPSALGGQWKWKRLG